MLNVHAREQAKGPRGLLSYAVSHEFCPWMNPYIDWLRKPIGWFVCAIMAAAIAGQLLGPQGFIVMWGLLAVLAVGVIWPWLAMRGIQGSVQINSITAREGDELEIEFAIKNRWPIPVFGLAIEGQFQHSTEIDDPLAVSLSKIPAFSESTYRWRQVPQQRGLIPEGMPTMSTGFPFGIWKFSKPLIIRRPVLVWPRVARLQGLPSGVGRPAFGRGSEGQRSGNEGDIQGAREFRNGDSLRNVNWAVTARSRKLVVSERQSISQPRYGVFVDLQPERFEGQNADRLFENCIRTAASISSHLFENGSQVELVCQGLPAEIDGRSSTATGIAAVLDVLARLPRLHQLQDHRFMAASRDLPYVDRSYFVSACFRADTPEVQVVQRSAEGATSASMFCRQPSGSCTDLILELQFEWEHAHACA